VLGYGLFFVDALLLMLLAVIYLLLTGTHHLIQDGLRQPSN
jgi:hypothetical protein